MTLAVLTDESHPWPHLEKMFQFKSAIGFIFIRVRWMAEAASEIFIELNTPVPLSAACVRLFCCAGLIFRPHLCSMKDKKFENSVLVKANNGFV